MKNKVSLIVSPLLMYSLLIAINQSKMYIAMSMNYKMGYFLYIIYMLYGAATAWFLFECSKCLERKFLNLICGFHFAMIALIYLFMLCNLQYMIADFIYHMCIMMGIIITVLIRNNINV